MKRNDYSIEQVADAIKTSKSLAEVMRKLGLRPSGGNYDNRLENLLIVCPNCHAQTEHYRGNAKRRYNDFGDLG